MVTSFIIQPSVELACSRSSAKGVRYAGLPTIVGWPSGEFTPAFSFAIIPDVIDGSEQDNDDLMAEWPFPECGVPVFHLHEPLTRLERLARSFDRVALGSSGIFRTPGSLVWWDRIAAVMETICDERGYPDVKLHGLRMFAPDLIETLPLASADSSSVARNLNLDKKLHGPMAPASRLGRALAHCERIESVLPATRWAGMDGRRSARSAVQQSLWL